MKTIEYTRTEYTPNSNIKVVRMIMTKILESELEELSEIKKYSNEEFLNNRQKIEKYMDKLGAMVSNLSKNHFEQRELLEDIVKERDYLEEVLNDLQNE